MKRILALVMAVVMCVLCFGCGKNEKNSKESTAYESISDKKLKKACMKADKLIQKWDADGMQICSYDSVLASDDEGSIYFISMYDKTYDDYSDAAKQITPLINAKWAYGEIKDCFAGVSNVDICVTVFDNEGEEKNVLVRLMNGNQL